MRKFSSFMAAAVAMLAAVSCNKEINNIDPVTPGADAVVYTAYVDGAETKTILGDDKIEGDKVKTTAKWSGEELITIHDGNKGFTFYTNAAEASTSAEFTYEGDDFTASEVMAVYPSGEYTANVAAKTVSGIVIPDKQTLVAGTYPATAAVAVAYTEDNTLEFKNATTLLKFKVADENITYGAFYADNGSGDLTGSFSLDYNGGAPSLTSVEAKQWVDFYLENSAAFSTEATYYIAVAPASFATGFGISLNGVEIKKFEGQYDLKRNVILDLGTLELPEVPQDWSVTGTFNEWADADMSVEGDWFVAKSITITTADRFKFRAGHDWTHNRGNGQTLEAGKVYEGLTQGGSDMYVSVSAIYDVYLSKDTYSMKLVKVGDYVDPTPEPTGTPVEANHIYLKPSSEWLQANAHFAAWVWADGGSGKLYNFKKHTSVDGIYEIEVPAESDNIILFRLDPNKTYAEGSTAWPGDDQWFKSGDIKISGNNLFTIVGWNTINPTKVTEL